MALEALALTIFIATHAPRACMVAEGTIADDRTASCALGALVGTGRFDGAARTAASEGDVVAVIGRGVGG
jgi:hypothetical protein